MTWWLIVLSAVGVVTIAVTVTAVIVRRKRTSVAGAGQPRRISITLALVADDPSSERIQRMVSDATSRLFRMMAALEEIEVRDTRGTLLGVRTRIEQQRATPSMSVDLFEPHTVRRPSMPAHWNEEEIFEAPSGSKPMGAMVERWLRDEPLPRVLTERFDLHEQIRARISDPDDLGDLITAILEAGGLVVTREAGMLRVGDTIVYLIRTPPGATVTAGALTRAYGAFRASGARRGFVVVLGHVDPIDVRRRELLAPDLVHLGADAIQRMADAAAFGADPLLWARWPVTEQQAGS